MGQTVTGTPRWMGEEADMNLREELFKYDQTQTLFGRQILQSWAALFVYEKLLNAHRDEIRWIGEIGTATGMLMTYFASWNHFNDGCRTLFTVDNKAAYWAWPLTEDVKQGMWNRAVLMYEANCFDIENELADNMQNGTGLLFCDGGQKARELATFAPHCPSGSLIVVHDYPIEITDEQIDAVECVERYEPWHSQSIELGTKAAILKRT